MTHDWTPEDRKMLERRWRAGDTSGAIAADMPGVSRNAVMGMLNRMGLMGVRENGRTNVNRKSPVMAAREIQDGLELWSDAWSDALETTAHMGSEETPTEDGETMRQLLSLDLEMALIVTAARTGRDPAAMRFVCGPEGGGDANVDDMIRRLDASGVWPVGTVLPERWRSPTTNGPAMILDAMAIAGWLQVRNGPEGVSYHIVSQDPPGEHRKEGEEATS